MLATDTTGYILPNETLYETFQFNLIIYLFNLLKCHLV